MYTIYALYIRKQQTQKQLNKGRQTNKTWCTEKKFAMFYLILMDFDGILKLTRVPLLLLCILMQIKIS